MANLAQKKYPPEEDYPDLSKHNNWMAKCLTAEIYAKLRDVVTPNGVTIDQVTCDAKKFSRNQNCAKSLQFLTHLVY